MQLQPPARNVGRPVPIQQAPKVTTVNPLSSLFVVQIDWTDDGEGSYDKTETKFYKLDPGKSSPRKNMEVNLLDLGE